MERITASETAPRTRENRWGAYVFRVAHIFRRGGRRALIGGLLAGAWALGTPGCGPPTENVVNANGTPIRLTAISRITDDEELTDSEKREQLQALGLQDEALIELLLK